MVFDTSNAAQVATAVTKINASIASIVSRITRSRGVHPGSDVHPVSVVGASAAPQGPARSLLTNVRGTWGSTLSFGTRQAHTAML